MKLWKRNAVVVAIVIFVGAAVYLNWSYGQKQEADPQPSGKVLGQATLVGGPASVPPAQSGSPASPSPSAGADTDADADADAGADTAPILTGYFSAARLNRQQARDSALEILQQAASDAMATQTVIDNANTSIQRLATNTLSEAQVENLVIAKGYADCVCYINENSASVVVSETGNGLTDADTARIAEIVMEETGLSALQIKIIEARP